MYFSRCPTADGRKFAVSRTFRFCLDKECISTQPVQSNLVVPPMSVTINESVNVTPEGYQLIAFLYGDHHTCSLSSRTRTSELHD